MIHYLSKFFLLPVKLSVNSPVVIKNHQGSAKRSTFMLIQVLSFTDIILLLFSYVSTIHKCRHCYCHLPDDQMNANENESLMAEAFLLLWLPEEENSVWSWNLYNYFSLATVLFCIQIEEKLCIQAVCCAMMNCSRGFSRKSHQWRFILVIYSLTAFKTRCFRFKNSIYLSISWT